MSVEDTFVMDVKPLMRLRDEMTAFFSGRTRKQPGRYFIGKTIGVVVFTKGRTQCTMILDSKPLKSDFPETIRFEKKESSSGTFPYSKYVYTFEPGDYDVASRALDYTLGGYLRRPFERDGTRKSLTSSCDLDSALDLALSSPDRFMLLLDAFYHDVVEFLSDSENKEKLVKSARRNNPVMIDIIEAVVSKAD